ncbi:MAG: energy transducer TonB [Candidatus Eremiobacteraeota bacterium]|nr:energy transducer TonB [Candidatus Eremiobacteraeota bacterium]
MIPLICMQPDRPAALVRASTPDLPPMALQQGIGGVVRVRVSLDASGAVRDVVVTSTPSGILRSESLRAARASTFAPARRRCVNVASAYEFRVLYDPERPPALPPRPTPSPSPMPPPAPNLAQPWQLVWSTSGSYSYSTRTLSSSRSYSRIDDTFPISHRVECRVTLSTAAFERFTAELRASRAERWRSSYRVGAEPTAAPSPVPVPTSTPAVDVVAVVRGEVFIPHTADAGSSKITLTASRTSYETSFEYGYPPGVEPVPAEVENLTRAFEAADAACKRR